MKVLQTVKSPSPSPAKLPFMVVGILRFFGETILQNSRVGITGPGVTLHSRKFLLGGPADQVGTEAVEIMMMMGRRREVSSVMPETVQPDSTPRPRPLASRRPHMPVAAGSPSSLTGAHTRPAHVEPGTGSAS
eukprot:2172613-Rhodomonas_salina.1